MKILLIDPSEATAQKTITFLDTNDYESHIATDIRSGWEYLREHIKAIAAVIITVEMEHPLLNGLDLVREARRIYPYLPLFVLSAKDSPFFRRQADLYHADCYLGGEDIRKLWLYVGLFIGVDELAQEMNDVQPSELFLRNLGVG